ncbi:hypothetical protein [Methanobrevibacter millerae]|uniref:Polymorphic outer membrane protein repeat-containing protein n=1 Tax=Methanobrevibacter millerae TaxID=230361 RepID=A0A1G5V9L5_9EURY|nr:hypothetical protein [Methanobrevibacter millerae]SDA42552.1 polymorphic outer membrane protein repeat-containing protein [Methanobrevibacter millerae]
MKVKFLILIVFVFIVSMAAVSAADDSNQTLAISQEDVNLGDNQGTFGELQEIIDAAPEGSEITLEKNYSIEDKSLFVNKSLTINGNGFTLDGNSTKTILYVSGGGDVELINIKFINGKDSRLMDAFAGAIYSSYTNLTIDGCVFESNSAVGAGTGGAIASFYDNLTIKNSLFISNEASNGRVISGKAAKGGAIYAATYSFGKGLIENCTFINNVARAGGAIYCDNLTIKDCKFIENSAGMGGALSGNAIIDSSVFINNLADDDRGSAISVMEGYYSDFWLEVKNSVFISSKNVILIECAKNTIESCWFGNTLNDYSRKPAVIVATYYGSEVDNWLVLKVAANPLKLDERKNSTVVFFFDSYDDASGQFTPFYDEDFADIRFKLTSQNGVLNKSTASNDEEILFTSTNINDGVVSADYYGFGCSITLENTVTTVLDVPDVTKYYGGDERLVVTLTDKGNPISNANVTISINGVNYTRTTDSKGVASMALNLPSMIYDVTTTYGNLTVKSKVTVLKTISGENVTKMFRNGTQYYAAFADTHGYALALGTVVEFNINGVFYTRYTDSYGVAKMNINLNPGEYIITAKNPNSTEMYTNIITVLPTIVENYDLTKYYRNASQYSIRLLDDKGNPVNAGVNVKFNINGVFYTRSSNATGYVNMNINLEPGEYVITAEYNGLMASNKIKVLSVIETDDLTMKYRDGSKFNATILDGQGKPCANQKVTFNINGVFYEKVTDETGVAHLNINLMAGEYIITTTYNGLNAANKITISS